MKSFFVFLIQIQHKNSHGSLKIDTEIVARVGLGVLVLLLNDAFGVVHVPFLIQIRDADILLLFSCFLFSMPLKKKMLYKQF